MEYQGLAIEHFAHDTVRVTGDWGCFYIDPYQLTDQQVKTADIIFITHHHYDHCSPEDIQKIIMPQTKIISSLLCRSSIGSMAVAQHFVMQPGQTLQVDSIKVEAVPAYCVNKFRSPGVLFHPPEEQNLGFVITVNGVRLYHAGDTDCIPEMSQLGKIDVAFLPVSGTYVMTWQEAREAVQLVQPQIAIPMHYGKIVGSQSDAEAFKKSVSSRIEII